MLSYNDNDHHHHQYVSTMFNLWPTASQLKYKKNSSSRPCKAAMLPTRYSAVASIENCIKNQYFSLNQFVTNQNRED